MLHRFLLRSSCSQLARGARAVSVPTHGRRFLSSSAAAPAVPSMTDEPQFDKILIANRGEIACRVQRTAQRLGIKTVAVYSEADANAEHVRMADEAYCIGPPAAAESYLLGDKILDVARKSGAQAIHPGYGFLSENSQFCVACKEAGVEFIGPPVQAIEAMGSKSASKDIMIAAGVPVTPGYHGEDQSIETLQREADGMGYPVLIKAILGGGGKGMRIVEKKEDLVEAVEACKREAQASFGDTRVLIEKYLRRPRHVELQVFADKKGNTVYLFERDCSVQRRYQKVLEEAPAPHMSDALRKKMGEAAVAAAKAVGYVGAGTVEFMLDEDESFYFMEMNTRLQVEHPVTELITKKDLVELQLRVAAGQDLPFSQKDLKIHGHAIEARVYAENPYNNFLPATGKLKHVQLPSAAEGSGNLVRVDTGVFSGDSVSIFYDPMIAKLIVHGPNRTAALKQLVDSLLDYEVVGVPTNIEFLARTASHPEFVSGGVNTSFLTEFGDELTKPFDNIPKHAFALTAASILLREELEQSLLATTSSEPTSPWGRSDLTAYRVFSTSTRRVALNHGDELVSMDVKHLAANEYEISFVGSDLTDDEQTFNVRGEIDESGAFSIRLGNVMYNGRTVLNGNDVHVFCKDGTLRYEYQLKLPVVSFNADGVASGKPVVLTPMPGKVIKVHVQEGDDIKSGQPLMILEAMKMEHVIRASQDGKVAKIHFGENDFVDDGKALVELESVQEDQ